MSFERIEQLVKDLREEAEHFSHRGLEREARLIESVANDVEQAWREWWLEELSPQDAAAEASLSTSALHKRVAAGTLVNRGKRGSPRYRRCDLFSGSRDELSLVADAREPDLADELLAGLG